jgi:O-antigen/teichoic acid export membrane protein
MELLFGPAYEAGSHAFVLLMVSMAAYSVHAPLSLSFLVRQRTGQQAIIYAGAALLNVVANVMLIPRFGIVGAAVAAICAEASIAVACLWALRSSSPWRPMLRGLVEPVGCAAVMALALVTVAGRMHVLIQILLGGSLYVTLLWLTTMRRRRAQG